MRNMVHYLTALQVHVADSKDEGSANCINSDRSHTNVSL